jgi:hypothetical protein
MLGPPAKIAAARAIRNSISEDATLLSISNRESLRLETGVSQTKQTPTSISNRELEPLFTTPFHKSTSAPIPIASPNSNRESLRLETDVTQTKQTPTSVSNREVEPLFTGLSTRLVSPGGAAWRNRLQEEARYKVWALP